MNVAAVIQATVDRTVSTMPQINAARFNDLRSRGCASVTFARRTEVRLTGTLRTEVLGNVSSAATDSTMAMIVPPLTGPQDSAKKLMQIRGRVSNAQITSFD